MGPAGYDDSGNDGYADEIAERYEALNEEQKARYRRKISVFTDAWGELSGEYKLGLLKAYANNRTDAGELDRKEYLRAHVRDQRLDREADERIRTREAKAGESQNNARPGDPVKERPRDPMEGIRPSGRYRDYGALERTHGEVAQQNARIVPGEKLKKMLKGYERVRKKKGLKTSQAEERGRVRLGRAQDMDRAELQGREAARGARDPASRIALAHQHLAERAALEARMLGEAMSGRDAGANRYRREGVEALYTARVLEERRQYRDGPGSRVVAGRDERGEKAQRQNSESIASTETREAALGSNGNAREVKKPETLQAKEPQRVSLKDALAGERGQPESRERLLAADVSAAGESHRRESREARNAALLAHEQRQPGVRVPAAEEAPKTETPERGDAGMLSGEALRSMLDASGQARQANNLEPLKNEEQQRSLLKDGQASDREQLERREAVRGGGDPASHTAMDHQHLTEPVGLEAGLRGDAMREKDPAAAERYGRDTREALEAVSLVREQPRHLENFAPSVAAGQEEQRTEARREGDEREALKEAQNAKGGRFGVTSEAKEAVKLLLARPNTGRTDGGRTGGRSR